MKTRRPLALAVWGQLCLSCLALPKASEWAVAAAEAATSTSSQSHPSPSTLSARPSLPGASAFTAPYAFPTEVFSSYYNDPASPSTQPQPVIARPNHHHLHDDGGDFFPRNLTDPFTLPILPPDDDVVYPGVTVQSPLSDEEIIHQAIKNVSAVIDGTRADCDKCAAGLAVGQLIAKMRPRVVPEVLRQLCIQYEFSVSLATLRDHLNWSSPIDFFSLARWQTTCNSTYAPSVLGSIWTQVLAYANLGHNDGTAPSLDAQYICSLRIKSACPLPATTPRDKSFFDSWFPKPKPSKRVTKEVVFEGHHRPRPAKGDRLKVLHLSDLHIDPRYAIGAESNGSSSQGCRSDTYNPDFATGPPDPSQMALLPPENISAPAGRFGEFNCDSPYSLLLSALEAIPVLSGGKVGKSDLDAVVVTGDITTHDAPNHISRELVEYSDTVIFHLLKRYLGEDIPVWVALGQ
jgi:sphingomyelin phosphodiesterase